MINIKTYSLCLIALIILFKSGYAVDTEAVSYGDWANVNDLYAFQISKSSTSQKTITEKNTVNETFKINSIEAESVVFIESQEQFKNQYGDHHGLWWLNKTGTPYIEYGENGQDDYLVIYAVLQGNDEQEINARNWDRKAIYQFASGEEKKGPYLLKYKVPDGFISGGDYYIDLTHNNVTVTTNYNGQSITNKFSIHYEQ